MSHTASEGPRRHRLTVADYYRMAEVGILAPDARVELIDGDIIDMTPPGALHAGTVDQLASLLSRTLGERAVLRIQSPISLDDYSEPQPDLTLLRPRGDYYKRSHPRPDDIWLVVEVGDISVGYDRDEKVPRYARAGIVEVWLADLRERRLTRYRQPVGAWYGRVDYPDLKLPIDIAAAGARVDLSTLFA